MSKKEKIEVVLPVLAPGVTLVDTHCHLDMPDYGDEAGAVLGRAARAGVTRIITIGIDLESSRRAVALAAGQRGVFAAVGVHPHHVEGLTDEDYEALRRLATRPGVVAYGEIGMDLVKVYAPAARQIEHFRRQVRLARELDLPVIIHDREAHAQILAILHEEGPFPARGVMHCFSGNAEFARQVVALGFYLSIPGVVTFPKAADLHQTVREIGLDHLLLETDGPFLAPVPWRGKRNEPSYLLHTAARVAELKGVALDEVARQTTRNARQLFRLGEEEEE